MVLSAIKNRAGWALQTDGEDKGLFLRAEHTLLPYICSAIRFESIKSHPVPIGISRKISADFSRLWKGPSRGWGATTQHWTVIFLPDCSTEWWPYLAPHAQATHGRAAQGWPDPCSPGKWSRLQSPGVERLQLYLFSLDYCSYWAETAQKL